MSAARLTPIFRKAACRSGPQEVRSAVRNMHCDVGARVGGAAITKEDAGVATDDDNAMLCSTPQLRQHSTMLQHAHSVQQCVPT